MGFFAGEIVQVPDGENLRALVDALESFFGFGDGFDRGDPEGARVGGGKRDADALPAVFEAHGWAGKFAAETQIFLARAGFEEAVVGGRR